MTAVSTYEGQQLKGQKLAVAIVEPELPQRPIERTIQNDRAGNNRSRGKKNSRGSDNVQFVVDAGMEVDSQVTFIANV